MLGRVKEVRGLKVMVSLPQGLLGTLAVTAISHAFTQRLQAAASTEGEGEVSLSVSHTKTKAQASTTY